MSDVYVFPGQGSQRRGMGEGLFERFADHVAQADAYLGYSVRELCLEDPDRVLSQTQYTQPALYVVNVLTYLDRIARERPPAIVAGHSLGEYCALFAAGAFDFATGLELVRRRGELMSQAPKGAMAAVVNLDPARVAEVLAELPCPNVDIANINSREQVILSGDYDELHAREVRKAYSAAGGTLIPLNVSAAFHSRCMAGVEQEFARYLEAFSFGELTLPVVANYTARPYPATGYTHYLTRQISNPVRWYESMSWLVHRGHRTFHEIGPGDVLTKLTTRILEDPLPIEDDAPPAAAPAPSADRRQIVFMYGGQGTQYHGMGRGLYEDNPVFRAAMDECSAAFESATGASLVDAIYDPARAAEDFDDILLTHPALYSIGWSLTRMLREEGVEPDAVLGHSLGEYVAATVAGALSFEEGMRLVIAQSRLAARAPRGGMLSILAPPALYEERSALFAGVDLAGVNFARNFAVSGDEAALVRVQAALDEEGFPSVLLPVRFAFHSHHVDALSADHRALAAGVRLRPPRLPVYSSTTAGLLDDAALARPEEYLWDVVRRPVRFAELIASAFPEPGDRVFVDLSATGSLANFLKHGFGGTFRSAAAINQFGNNNASMQALRERLGLVPAAA